jgi:uncharacterized protein
LHTADYWIDLLQLKPHPEGGYYREIYRADETMAPEALPNRYQSQAHVFSTAIYFLLKAGEPSKFHRLQSDELWHYYAGSSVTIHLIDERGEHLQKVLGPDYEKGQAFMQVIPQLQWFGATVNSVVEDTSAEENPRGYVLIGCTVAPGFEFGDFELGRRSELLAQYPQYASLIHELT